MKSLEKKDKNGISFNKIKCNYYYVLFGLVTERGRLVQSVMTRALHACGREFDSRSDLFLPIMIVTNYKNPLTQYFSQPATQLSS